jgi:hypothetical protein
MKAKIAPGVELNQPVVRVVRGHGGKMLTTEIAEDTEGRSSPRRRVCTEGKGLRVKGEAR